MTDRNTLLLRLSGPMQSWGTQSRFDVRDTGLEPSKSGVVGLICAAMGRPRHEEVDDLAALRMGVRVEREGVVSSDYQTAGGALDRSDPFWGVATAKGPVGANVVSRRMYLADADFVVGLESSDAHLLERVEAALRRPVWPIFLGRKGYVPSIPVHLPGAGIHACIGMEEALASIAVADRRGPAADRLRVVIEAPLDQAEQQRRDQPLGRAFLERTFGLRGICTTTIDRPKGEG